MSKYGIHSSPFIVNGRILWLYRMLAKGLSTQQVSTTESNLRKKILQSKYFLKKNFFENSMVVVVVGSGRRGRRYHFFGMAISM